MRNRESGCAALLLASAFAGLVAMSEAAPDYGVDRAASVKACEAIDAAASQSGLMGNPDGYRSYYDRSMCFQQTAVNFRDDSLCAKVRQRRSLLFSSWGYSPAQCRTLVAAGIASDRATMEALKRKYLKGAVGLRDFRIEPNGNGRDFNIIPAFTGGDAAGYRLTFEILPSQAGAPPALVHSSGYWLDARANLQIYVRAEDIRRVLPGFAPDRTYEVRGTAILSVPIGDGEARWSDAFVERAFPARERSQSMIKQVKFPR